MEHIELKNVYNDHIITRYEVTHKENGAFLAEIRHEHCETSGKDEAVVYHWDNRGRQYTRHFDKDKGGFYHMGETPIDAAKSWVRGYIWELERGVPLRKR